MVNAEGTIALTGTQLVDEGLDELGQLAEERTPQVAGVDTSTLVDAGLATTTLGLPFILEFDKDTDLMMRIVGAGRAASVVVDVGGKLSQMLMGQTGTQQTLQKTSVSGSTSSNNKSQKMTESRSTSSGVELSS